MNTDEPVGETNQPANEPPTTYQEQMAMLFSGKGIVRLLGYLVLLHFLVLFFLGFVFLAILFPLTLAFARLALIYTPAYHLLGRIMGINGMPAHLSGPSKGLAIYSWVYTAFWVGVSLVFLRLVFFAGFCNQNFLCLLSRLLLK